MAKRSDSERMRDINRAMPRDLQTSYAAFVFSMRPSLRRKWIRWLEIRIVELKQRVRPGTPPPYMPFWPDGSVQ